MTLHPPLPAKITKEEIATLPQEEYAGQIVVVDRPEDVARAVAELSAEARVGFDTETRPNFRKDQHHKVSLVQVATEETCYLFRLNCLGGIPEPLVSFLSDADVTKIGLSLADDFHMLRERVETLQPAGFIELQKLMPSYGINEAGLQKIYAILFQKKISKRARLTNWDANLLTPAQQKYAALDAWACLRIYKHLCS